MSLEETIKYYEKIIEEFEKIKKIKAITPEEIELMGENKQRLQWFKELAQFRKSSQSLYERVEELSYKSDSKDTQSAYRKFMEMIEIYLLEI